MKHLVCGEVSTDRCYSCWDFSLSPFGVKDQSVRCVLLSLLEVKMSLYYIQLEFVTNSVMSTFVNFEFNIVNINFNDTVGIVHIFLKSIKEVLGHIFRNRI